MVNVEREGLWKERVEQWREGGLSQRAYALAHGFPPRQVGYWVRRLTSGAPIQTLVPVTITAAAAVSTPALTLRSPGGWAVSLPAGLPPTTLAELLRCLP